MSYKEGWVCPKCGRVYSPLKLECTYCNTIISHIQNNTTGGAS
jgi:uncharacterized OB-fold protein